MRLYLLRHAEAADTYPDPERNLTAKGRRDAEALGRLLGRQEVKAPRRIWTSAYARARETAECILATSPWPVRPETRDGLTPYDDPAELLHPLSEISEDLLIVGHNPYLSLLAGYLLGGVDGLVLVHFRKCALMRFERIERYDDDPRWILSWMLPPKLFRE